MKFSITVNIFDCITFNHENSSELLFFFFRNNSLIISQHLKYGEVVLV